MSKKEENLKTPNEKEPEITQNVTTDKDGEGNLNLNNISAINQTFEPDPWYVTLGYSLGKAFKSLGLWLWDLLLSIFKAFIGIFIGIYKGIIKFGKWVKRFSIQQKKYFEEADTNAKVSYGVMGFSYLRNKQYFKGILYLIAEVGFIVFMVLAGGKNLHLLTSLGDTEYQVGHWDDSIGAFTEPTAGDNSIKCLLYGIITVIIIILFVICYFSNVKGANSNCHIVYNIKYHNAYKTAIDTVTNRQKELYENCTENGTFFKGAKLRKALVEKLGMDKFDALILSRANFEMMEKGYYEGTIEGLKNDYSKHSHTFDRYNVYYERIQTMTSEIKGYQMHNELKPLIEQSVNKKGKLDRKEGICQIVNATEANVGDANVIYDDFMKTQNSSDEEINKLISGKEEELKAYIEGHPEKMDSRFYSFKKEAGTYLDEKFAFTIMLLPTLMCTIMVILPLLFTVFIAFTEYDGLHTYPRLFTWTGFSNLSNLFVAGEGAMKNIPNTVWTLLGWTLVWAVFATFLNYIFGMILALLINKKGIKLKKLWRTIFVLTIAIPSFISLTCMGKLLGDTGSIVQTVYRLTGQKIHFLSDYDITVTKVMIIVVDLWIGIPYTMLMTSGILMNIPEDLYESAKIDGAGPFTQFFKITLPYMLFVTGPHLITQFVGNINNFNVIYFLTGSITTNVEVLYKAKPTDLLITWLYSLATGTDQKYNIASVIGIFIFIICAFFSLIFYSKTSAVQNEEDFQ